MYQVKAKAVVTANNESPVRYKPMVMTGIFVPKTRTCKKERIEQLCIDFIKPQLKQPEGTTLQVIIVSIKKIPDSFICVEDK